MKKLLLAFLLFSVCPVVARCEVAKAQNMAAFQEESSDVPLGHWSYEAIQYVSQTYTVVSGGCTLRMGKSSPVPMTRFEFAVGLARMFNEKRTSIIGYIPEQAPSHFTLGRATFRDSARALIQEFKPELHQFGLNPDDSILLLRNDKPATQTTSPR